MRAPPSLLSLLEDGLIEAVVRPLQSGKEAQIYLVVANGEHRVAKVYKQANDRTFKHRTDYVEGRGTRNTRDQRAMKRRSSYGRSKDEDSWRSTEVEMIYRLREAGVRVPAPHLFSDGVLIMELVQGSDGGPAPRIGDLHFTAEEAIAIHDALLRDVIRMLCAGVVHGDLSEFNVLMDGNGPVIIDLPQAVDASSNPNAKKLLVRDVENIQRFIQRWVPGQKRKPFAAEMWSLYEVNELAHDTELTGTYKGPEGEVDTAGVLDMIDDAREDETQRRLGRGQKALPSRMRTGQVHVNKQSPPSRKKKSAGAAGRPKPKAKAKPKPKPETPPPSKALSKDELIAQAIAAAKEAAANPKPRPKPSESGGRKRKRRGEADSSRREQPRQRRSRAKADAPSETPRRGRAEKRADAPSDAPRRRRSEGSTDSPSDAPRRRRSNAKTDSGSDAPRRQRSGERSDSGSDAPRRRRSRRRDDAPEGRNARPEGERKDRPSQGDKPDDTRRRRRRRSPSDDSGSSPAAPQGREGESRRRSRSTRESGDGDSGRGQRRDRDESGSRRRREAPESGEPRRRRDSKPATEGEKRPQRSEGSDGSAPKRRRRRRRSGGSSGNRPPRGSKS